MSNGPRHAVDIAMHVSIALCGGAQYFRDVTRDRGLLGQNRHCPGFPRGVAQRSILEDADSGGVRVMIALPCTRTGVSKTTLAIAAARGVLPADDPPPGILSDIVPN